MCIHSEQELHSRQFHAKNFTHPIDPVHLIFEQDLDKNILKSEKWDVLNPSDARIYIDKFIFDILELTQGERDGVYEAVTKLVTTRLQKAKT